MTTVVLMLLHLYSYYVASKAPVKRPRDEERTLANGHARMPNVADRQAHDAQEFELEGLMSEDEDDGAAKPGANGRPR